MKQIRFFFDSNLWLALGAAALEAYCAKKLTGSFLPLEVALVFFYILLVYNVHGLWSAKRHQIFDIKAIQYYRSKFFLYITVTSVMMICLLIILLPFNVQCFGIVYLVLGMVYGSRVLPIIRKGKLVLIRPRETPGVKAIAAALFLSSFFIAIPYLSQDLSIEKGHLPWIIFIFVHLFGNTIIGDLRDYRLDSRKKVKTLPVVLGFEKVKYGLIFFNLLFAMVLLFLNCGMIEIYVTLVIQCLFITFIHAKTKKEFYHSVDAIHFLPVASLSILNHF